MREGSIFESLEVFGERLELFGRPRLGQVPRDDEVVGARTLGGRERARELPGPLAGIERPPPN